MSERVCVGAIAGAFGVRGAVRLKSFCAEPDAIETYGPLQSEDGSRSFELMLDKPVKGGFIAVIKGLTSKEEAEALRGTRLFVPRERLPRPGDDEFYHADLIGLAAQDPGGFPLGKVAAVLNHGAGDLLELRGAGRKPVLVPFTHEIVPLVDLTGRCIVVDAPPGLLTDDASDDEG